MKQHQKLPWYFYLLIEKPLSRLVQAENTFFCIFKLTGQVRESQKKGHASTLIKNTIIHLPKSVSTDITIKSDSV